MTGPHAVDVGMIHPIHHVDLVTYLIVTIRADEELTSMAVLSQYKLIVEVVARVGPKRSLRLAGRHTRDDRSGSLEGMPPEGVFAQHHSEVGEDKSECEEGNDQPGDADSQAGVRPDSTGPCAG